MSEITLGNIKNKRVFVSGGAGVIGQTLVRVLHQHGAIIFVGDLKPKPKAFPADVLYRQGDLNFITFDEVNAFEPELFFHLAATFERSDESYEFWDENRKHNVQLSTHLMTIFKEIPTLKKVVFASSYLIYDKKLYTSDKPFKAAVPLQESDIINPRNLTGCAKLNHEVELRFLNEYKRQQFKTVSARIYRSYGRNSRDIISRWIRALLKGEKLTVFRPEGMFDYVFADDVAMGLILLGLNDQAEGVVNLGRGNARRIVEVLDVLQQHFPNLTYDSADTDIPYEGSQADNSLLRSIIGWAPCTDIETSIPVMIAYEKEHPYEENEFQPFNLLITSLSAKIPLAKAVKNAAQKFSPGMKVFGGDMNPDCLGRYFVDAFWQMPRLNDEAKPAMLQYFQQNNIKGIIPTRDGELPFWSAWKTELAQNGIHVMVSQPNAVDVCLDKFKFYQSFPQQVIETALEINQLSACDYYVVKEQFGAGSRSMGLNLDKTQALQHATTLEAPMFQPFVKGQEYSIDMFYTQQGLFKGGIARKRELVVDGESKITTTVHFPALVDVCKVIGDTLKLNGHLVFQAFVEGDNIKVIECNSRFGGASTLSIAAGLDSFFWFISEIAGNDISQQRFVPAAHPIRQVRIQHDHYFPA